MSRPSDGIGELLEDIRRESNARWELIGRLDGGLQGGVHELCSEAGDRAVLKFTEDAEWGQRVLAAAPVVERVRQGGYPTPEWLAHGAIAGGGAWVVQAWASGRPLDIRAPEVPAMLGTLIESQSGMDPEPSRNWSEYISEVVAGDIADRLRESGPEGRAVVDDFRRALHGRPDVDMPGGDLVHGDLSPSNVHTVDGRVTSVVDIEALGSGTRVTDWATAIRSAWTADAPRPVIDDLTRRARAVAGAHVLALCSAAVSIEFAAFLIRREAPSLGHDVRRLLEFAGDLRDLR